MSYSRLLAILGAICSVFAISSVAVAETPTAHPDQCSNTFELRITSHTPYHLPTGAGFKDGPGGTIAASVTKSSTISASMSVSSEVNIGAIVAKAKVTVSASVEKSRTVTVGHQYSHPINRGKYGHLQYGSWGYTLGWKYYQYYGQVCQNSKVIDSGSAKVPTNSVGWRYWETNS